MTIEHIEVSTYRVPIKHPVATSFGIMRDRPAVFVRLTDTDGTFGWGEIFANWPAAGAEHRARLLIEDMADVVFAAPTGSLVEFTAYLTTKTRIRAIQCAEPGPFAQVIAGLDTAQADIMARRSGVPLARFLAADSRPFIPVYASGIAANGAAKAVQSARAQGYKAFKIKVGFDLDADLERLKEVRAIIGPTERLFADANQAWDVSMTLAFMESAKALQLGWIEEPLPADSPSEAWATLASRIDVPIAAGENIAGTKPFQNAIRSGHFGVLQPDVAKWGGVSGCFGVARAALDAGITYCPHFLGGGIGLIASAHLLAAVGGTGLLEVDINANPLRDAFGLPIDAKGWQIPDAPGLGIEDIPPELEQFQTLALTTHRTKRSS